MSKRDIKYSQRDRMNRAGVAAWVAWLVLTVLLSALNAVAGQSAPRDSERLSDPTRPLGYRAPARAVQTLQLNSILLAQGRKVAVINGRQYVEDEQSGGLRVISIRNNSVVVDHNGRRRTLTLHHSIRR